MALSIKTIKLNVRKVKEYFIRHKFLSVMTTVSLLIGIRAFARRNTTVSESSVESWVSSPYITCDVSFIGYGKKFAVLRYAHIDVKTRTFSIPCMGYKPYYRFTEGLGGNILNKWMKNMTLYEYSYSESLLTTTIAIYRIEAHNLYHSMCEWYNIFLVCSLLNLDPKQVTILFMDDRPPSLLEDLWYILFGNIARYQLIPTENVYRTLIWNIFGYQSPMNDPKLDILPYIEEFREFVFNSYSIHQTKKLNCKSLNVTLIYRRDFVSHPERADGVIQRKFHNNSDVFSVVSKVFNGHKVTGLFLEYFSVKEQLQIITDTDILIGMHGAGLSHIIFLPSHAGVFEMFPKYIQLNDKYKTFARWRGIKYTNWKNTHPVAELSNFETRIPADILYFHLNNLKRDVCG